MSTYPNLLTQEKSLAVRICVAKTPQGLFDYLLPKALLGQIPENKALGHLIQIPFGSQICEGVVWDNPFPESCSTVPKEKLRNAIAWIDSPPLSQELLIFIDRMANYSMASHGQILRMILGPKGVIKPAKKNMKLEAVKPHDKQALTPTQSYILAHLQENSGLNIKKLAEETQKNPATIRHMIKKNLIKQISCEEPTNPFPIPTYKKTSLSPKQQQAYQSIKNHTNEKKFSTLLLDGETGSGKTEIYFNIIADKLTRGKQILILLPEIALLTQFIERFRQYFNMMPVLWHSGLSLSERRHTWHKIVCGAAPVLVGTRSALFLPFAKLDLIIIDEEHDGAYKQEEQPVYHARDMAVLRAHCEKIPIILASATPTLESLTNAETKRYHHITIKERFAGAQLANISVVDLRHTKRDRKKWISPPLQKKIAETLQKKQQTLLFLNRRGYAPLSLCHQCGFRLQCPDCTSWLVEHRHLEKLLCHHCGYACVKPSSCPQCQSKESLIACGPGVERIEEESRLLFPEANIAVITTDTVDNSENFYSMIQAIEARKIDILIGTQILAKGFHFPFLTLVGVIDADMGLEGGDLRASERNYQLLHQLTGRAGRDKARQGFALLQSFEPENPIIQALKNANRQDFLDLEKKRRLIANWPPYGKLASLILSSPHLEKLNQYAQSLKQNAPHIKDFDILGPAPAPIAIIKKRHRKRFLVKATRNIKIQPIIRQWIDKNPPPAIIRLKIDIDPWSFL